MIASRTGRRKISGDEHLSGKSPDRGTELCAVVEYMYSLEELYAIFGDNSLADRLEFLTFNALPGTMTPDMWAHQYDQQSNQVLVTGDKRDWSTNGNYSNIYGLMPNLVLPGKHASGDGPNSQQICGWQQMTTVWQRCL
jgi:hypothetical protein